MSRENLPQTRRYGAAAAFVDGLLAEGRLAFSMAALCERAGLSATAARCQLQRLGPRVARVSPAQPFFVIVTPEHAARGCPPVEGWLVDYFRWLGHPYYLALQSAAGAHGATPQAIQATQVMTDVPRRSLRVGRVQVTFYVKRGIAATPTQPLVNALAPLRVSTPAATVLDLIRYAPRIGGIGRAVETLRPLLAQVRSAELRAALDAEAEAATAQRLGYVCERLGAEMLATVVDRWLTGKRPVSPLAVGAPAEAGAAVNRRWGIVDNTRELDA